jgi:AcrR family transcriptional regulator
MKTGYPAVVREDDAPSKRALLEASLRLFVKRGVCETTIRVVAEEAGFTNPAIFKFFKSRDALALCVFERCYERLALDVEEAAAAPGFEARVRSIVHAAARFMDAELDAFLFVNEELRRFWPDVAPDIRRRSIVRMLRELFALGEKAGRVPRDRDHGLLVAATIGTLTQVGRALYFREISGPALRRAPELEALLLRIAR